MSPLDYVMPDAGEGEPMSVEDQNESNRMNPYGPGANADETRQAQHAMTNDMPVDVNINAVVARSQALTVDVLGKNFESNADRRNKIADAKMDLKPNA